jgi:hypothetical protein
MGAVGIGNGAAREIAAGDPQHAAPARHQCEQIGVRLLRGEIVCDFLGEIYPGIDRAWLGRFVLSDRSVVVCSIRSNSG